MQTAVQSRTIINIPLYQRYDIYYVHPVLNNHFYKPVNSNRGYILIRAVVKFKNKLRQVNNLHTPKIK